MCRRILKGDGRNNYLANILDSYLPDAKIYVKKEEQKVSIHYKMFVRYYETFPLFERDAQIRRLILEAVTLIKILEQEGYIMLFMNASEEPNSSIGAGPDKLISVDGEEEIIEIESKISDPSVINLLIEYNPKEIYVTKEFRVFCANGYIPRADVQFNQNLELTHQSLKLSKQSLELTNQSLELTKQSLELTRQSLDVTRKSYKVAIITLIVTLGLSLVSMAVSIVSQ